MLVSMKALAGIHFVPRELVADVQLAAQTGDGGIVFVHAARGPRVLRKPKAKLPVYRGMLVARARSRAASMRCSSADKVMFFMYALHTTIVVHAKAPQRAQRLH